MVLLLTLLSRSAFFCCTNVPKWWLMLEVFAFFFFFLLLLCLCAFVICLFAIELNNKIQEQNKIIEDKEVVVIFFSFLLTLFFEFILIFLGGLQTEIKSLNQEIERLRSGGDIADSGANSNNAAMGTFLHSFVDHLSYSFSPFASGSGNARKRKLPKKRGQRNVLNPRQQR